MMRIFTQVPAALLLACLSACQHGTHQPSMPLQLRVLTYNIHHGEGMDGRFDYERLARVIRSATLDLVALQEVDSQTARSAGVDQAAKLGELTGMHAIFGKAMDFQGGGYGEALLSRVPFVRTRNHPLPAGAGYEPRVLLEGVVRIGDSGGPLRFFGTHLDQEQTSERLNQARAIASVAGNDGDGLMILCGDLNASPDSAPLAPLMGVRDLYDVLAEVFPNPADRWTYHYRRNEQIDYLLVSRPLQRALQDADIDRRGIFDVESYCNNAIRSYNSVTSSANAASDHGAAWADFRIP